MSCYEKSFMRKKNHLMMIFIGLLGIVVSTSFAKTKSAACSPLDSNGYVLLHPYFNGKNWKDASENIELNVPDTLCLQPGLRPLRFDIGKNLDSTIAVFSTSNGDFFMTAAYFTQYYGLCKKGEIAFRSPQKVDLSGIALTETTPLYMIKDSLYNIDSIKVIIGASSQYVLALTIKSAASAIVKIDTLRMQNAQTVVGITGDFDAVSHHDTCIWVFGTNGMIRSFSYTSSAWGQEVNRDIAGLADTVLCVDGMYAGANTGSIYKKNASQAFILDNAASHKAITAIYPQGAIGFGGNFIERIGTSWRLDTLGTSNYAYANFIKRPGGFGVELLDSKWRYHVFTIRDTSSKILLTVPVDRSSYINNGVYFYKDTLNDTGMSIRISDPDSNYKDVTIALKRKEFAKSLLTDGVYSISPLPDTETCHAGVLRLTDGVFHIKFERDKIVIKSQTELGMLKIDCGTCYWKKYDFSATQTWVLGDSVIIKAGNDVFKIVDSCGNYPVNALAHPSLFRMNVHSVWCKAHNHRLIIHIEIPDLKQLSIFDISGKKIVSLQSPKQSVIEIPRFIASGLLYVSATHSNGAVQQFVLPTMR